MKAVMVEFRNEYGIWTYFQVYLKKTTRKAVTDYLAEHNMEFKNNDLKEVDGDLYFEDEVRAYEITLDDSK